MWLINTATFELESFMRRPPPYAILSHRWGSEKDEVSFKEWQEDHAKIRDRPGYIKILKARDQARLEGYSYLWVDTNCIDKSSSAELSEAINSMFRYYAQSVVCYAFLEDVDDLPNMSHPATDNDLVGLAGTTFAHSAWFTRGWTLQELLAPERLIFFSASWKRIGTKQELVPVLQAVTGIRKDYLMSPKKVKKASIARRLSWVSNRITTRLEDIAYCMLGILDVNMPLLYGEEHRAFQRLQEEVMKHSSDHSIFAWNWLPESGPHKTQKRADYLREIGWAYGGPVSFEMNTSILAADPVLFYASEDLVDHQEFTSGTQLTDVEKRRLAWMRGKPYGITNMGLSIALPCHLDAGEAQDGSMTGCIALITPQDRFHRLLQEEYLFPRADYTFLSDISALAVVLRHRPGAEGEFERVPGIAEDHYPFSRLLDVNIPWRLADRYFPTTDMVLPGNTLHGLITTAPPAHLGVWCLGLGAARITQRDHSRGWISHNASCGGMLPPDHYTRAIRTAGAIFELELGGFTRHVLVCVRDTGHGRYEYLDGIGPRRKYRGPKRGWDLREITFKQGFGGPRGPGRLWMFEGEERTLDDILEHQPAPTGLLDDPYGSLLCIIQFPGSGRFRVFLEGFAFWVSQHDSCIRFLHVEDDN